MRRSFSVTHDQLVVAEGLEEATFIGEMIAAGVIPPMDVGFIGQFGTGWGVTGILKHLVALYGDSNFSAKTKQLIIVADHDDGAQFQYIRDRIAAANSHPDVGGVYSEPTSPCAWTRTAKIAVKIVMMPDSGQNGCFETLLLRYLSTQYADINRCGQEFVQCTGLGAWSQSKIDKALVRIILAAVNRENPALPLSYVFKNHPDIIPVRDVTFSDLAVALSS